MNQSIELVWQQSQAFSNPFQNTLSVKQPVESTFLQAEFSLSLENIFFKKDWNQITLDHQKEWIKKFKYI